MTASTASAVDVTVTGDGRPFVVGIGGTLRANSSTERALRRCLAAVEQQGGRTALFSGEDINLPMYSPHDESRTPRAPLPIPSRNNRRAASPERRCASA